MNKMFTTAMAIAAVAGLASATIETPPAGYLEKAGDGDDQLVCIPFVNFDYSPLTLGDIDGSNLGEGGYLRIIDANGKVQLKAKYSGGNWYNFEDNTYTSGNSNSFPIVRGQSFQFKCASDKSLNFYGVVTNVNAQVSTQGGYCLVGNASPVAKTLGDFSVSGSFSESMGDYFLIDGVKYVYANGHWLTRDGRTNADTTPIAAGKGFFLLTKKRRQAVNTTITVPGTF